MGVRLWLGTAAPALWAATEANAGSPGGETGELPPRCTGTGRRAATDEGSAGRKKTEWPGEICSGRRPRRPLSSRCPPSPHYQPADCASGRGFGASSSQFPPPPARTAADRAARLPHTVRVVLSSTIYLSPCTYAPIQGPRLGLPRALCPISLPFSSIACCRGPFSLLYCFLSSHVRSSPRLPL